MKEYWRTAWRLARINHKAGFARFDSVNLEGVLGLAVLLKERERLYCSPFKTQRALAGEIDVEYAKFLIQFHRVRTSKNRYFLFNL